MLKIKLLPMAYFISCSALFAQIDSLQQDSLLLMQVQNQLAQSNPQPVQARSGISANPDISVIGDFRTSYRDNYRRHFSANMAETEFSFQSVIDPYAKADFFYSVSRDEETGEFTGEIEEGYLTTLSLPAHLQLKAGKFKQQVGRINPVHPHALAFVDMPNAYVRFFGEEGLNDAGFSLSWLLPNRLFFQELTVEATDGPHNSPILMRSDANHYTTLAHLKNFWDLTANATLELGLTGINGPNITQQTTNIAAADLTYKWKPVKLNTYRSFTFQNEFYYSSSEIDSNKVEAFGFYSFVNFQVAKRWFVTARYDYTNKPVDAAFREQAASATIGWYATEFQKIELEAKQTSANQEDELNNFKKDFTQVFLRWIFVIGTHGAHQY